MGDTIISTPKGDFFQIETFRMMKILKEYLKYGANIFPK